MKKFKKTAQGMLEYGLMAGLFAVVCITVASNIGTSAGDTTTNMVSRIDSTMLDTTMTTGDFNRKKSLKEVCGSDADNPFSTCFQTACAQSPKPEGCSD